MKTPSSTTAASIFRMVKPAYIFLLLSFVAVALDPLFLYIPIIDERNKCLGVDKTVRNAALILRSLSDIPFLIRIVIKIRSPDKNKNTATVPNSELHVQSDSLWTAIKKYFMSYPRLAKFAKGLALRMPWSSFDFIVEFLAILPVPQVAVAVLFFNVKGSGYFYERTIINLVLLFQYLPRIFQIYLHASSIKKIWIKGVLNFYLYILASHILGAIWYFLSIQQETICWHKACKNAEGCKAIHYCDEIDTSHSTNNITFLNEKCPINPANAKEFDFGIFLEALQSGNTAGQINFSTKFFYTLWWGFRNMSNYGTDLKTSNYLWENCFAILISAIGLLLFSYLIGNVQTCMQQLTSTNPLEVEKGK